MPEEDGTRISVGYVRRSHGLDGSVVVRPLTDAPETRFVVGASFSTDHDVVDRVTVTRVRTHKDGLLVTFDAVSDRNTADGLRGATLSINASDRRPLEPGEFWVDDLVGLTAVDGEGTPIGVVADVVLGSAQDRLVVRVDDGPAVEVPFVAALVGEVDAERRTITIEAPEGLF